MTAAPLDEAIALLCDDAGRITRILRDEIGIGDAWRAGEALPRRMDPASQAKAAHFLAALRRDRAALDWRLDLVLGGRQAMALHLAGIALADDGLLVVGGRSLAAAARLLGAVMRDQRPDPGIAHAVLSELFRWLAERDDPESPPYDELSRLNNELITMQRELVKRNAELARLNADMNRFLGIAAHDLRNPLAIILAYGDFLHEDLGGALEPRRARFIEAIRESSEFMLKLIDDLLDVSTIASGKLRLNPEPCDLDALIQRNLALNGVLADGKRLRLVYENKAALPRMMLDPMKIEQVLNNLVGNAIKVSPPAGTIRVELSRAGEGAQIRITDAGPGIATDELAAIFQPFRQGLLAAASGGLGVGLGLAIAQSIVLGHGGRIWAQSKPPDGATFSVLIPIVPAARAGR